MLVITEEKEVGAAVLYYCSKGPLLIGIKQKGSKKGPKGVEQKKEGRERDSLFEKGKSFS